MQESGADPEKPVLKEMVVEASRALARLDTVRLEELAVSCRVFTRALKRDDLQERRRLAGQAKEAQADMAVLARVLDATRANLNVMNRLRELRMGRLEYTERQARGGADPGTPSTASGRWGEDAGTLSTGVSKNCGQRSKDTEDGHGDH